MRYLIAIVATLVVANRAHADWKDDLKAEQAQNSARLVVIESQANPIASDLRKVNADIAKHNANRCEAPANNPKACAAYDRRAKELNTAQQGLVTRLRPLAAEHERLTARNQEIERKLKCVPLPKPCKTNADCNECSTCGRFDGNEETGVCQPRSR